MAGTSRTASKRPARTSRVQAVRVAVATTRSAPAPAGSGRRKSARTAARAFASSPAARRPSRSSKTRTAAPPPRWVVASPTTRAAQSAVGPPAKTRGSAASTTSAKSARPSRFAAYAVQAASVDAPHPGRSLTSSTDRGVRPLARARAVLPLVRRSAVNRRSSSRTRPCDGTRSSSSEAVPDDDDDASSEEEDEEDTSAPPRASRPSTSVAAAAASSSSARSRSPRVTRPTSSGVWAADTPLSASPPAARPSANEAAERTSPASSAPEKSTARAARPASPTSSTKAAASAAIASLARIARVWMRRMSRRPARSGRSIVTWTSRRPGRLRAGSMSSGRLVSPTTRTLGSSSTPSILARSWLTTPSRTPVVSPASEPRGRAMASISSRTMTWSADRSPERAYSSSAGRKSSRTLRSASPTNLSRISGPLTTRGSRAPSSRASSRASSVLPHPGGPESRTPRTCETPSRFASAGSAREARTRRTMASS
mmetsp:Transcript_25439/g.101394  ORF Transcript_25439/g.101394 Transcript_25439/m.101394 type:complete len:485 (-) Transcript_25439:1445-2899(-)